MAIRLIILIFCGLHSGLLSAQRGQSYGFAPYSFQNKKMLIIEGSANNSGLSFAPFRLVNGDYTVDEFEYASHPVLGSGFEINITISDIKQYDLVFVKLDMGSFSNNVLDDFAEYISQGGKLFILIDPKEKAHFIPEMEKTSIF